MKFTDMELRLVEDNPNLNAQTLAKLIGCKAVDVNRLRICDLHERKLLRTAGHWFHNGCGIPFTTFNKQCYSYIVNFKNQIKCTGNSDKCLNFVDHLIWCIEHKHLESHQPRPCPRNGFNPLECLSWYRLQRLRNIKLDPKERVAI